MRRYVFRRPFQYRTTRHLLVVLFPVVAPPGVAFTTKASGDWSSEGQTTWNEAGKPGDGDTATIDHDIVVDENTTIGDSPAAVDADWVIVISAAKSLTLAAGITLRSKGGITTENNAASKFQMEAGSMLILDGSEQGGNPEYRLWLDGAGVWNSQLVCNGTSGSHCTIRGEDATNRGYVRADGGVMRVDLTFTDFQYLGSAANQGVYFVVSNENVSVEDCTFDDVHETVIKTNADDGDWIINRNSWTNTTLEIDLGCVTATTGGRSCENNSFDETVRLNVVRAVDITSCIFEEGILQANSDPVGTRLVDCLVYRASAFGNLYNGIVDSYLIVTDNTNPHGFTLNTTYEDITASGNVMENVGTDSTDGDWMFADGEGNITLNNNIMLPNVDGDTSGSFLTITTSATPTVDIYHNTLAAFFGMRIAEGNPGALGEIANVKSNYFWIPKGVTKGFFGSRANQGAPEIEDIITPANFDYNFDDGNLNTDIAYGWQDQETGGGDMFSGIPANANGATATDAQFVDDTRNIAAWAAHKGEAETVAAGLTLCRNDTSLISDLVDWVSDGFAPQNSALDGTAHDAGTIGAVDFLAAAGNPWYYYAQQAAIAG